MTQNNSKKTGIGRLLIIGLVVAAIAVAIIYYIGWFDERTHVDTQAGDNVEANYELKDPESPAETEWQNADNKSLDEVITDPEAPTATPPTSE